MGETCIAFGGGYACEPPGTSPQNDSGPLPPTDAPMMMIDGHPDGHVTATDMDGDGVPDSSDNCPTVYNPDQANEDGDRFGDACDPCPPFPDMVPPTDSDNDGVSDACDPRPSTPGDKIFLFEGFHHGVPTTWIKTGTWAAGSNDDVTCDDTVTAAGATLTTPGPTDAEETVSTELVLLAAGTGGSRAGVVDDYDHTVPAGLSCQLNLTDKVNLFDIEPGTQVGNVAFTYAVGDRFELGVSRDAMAFTCAARDTTSSTSSTLISGNSATDSTTPEVGIRIHTTAVAVKWVMVVSH